MDRQWAVRGFFISLILVSIVYLGMGAIQGTASTDSLSVGDSAAEPRNNITVATTQAFHPLITGGWFSGSKKGGNSSLVAIGKDGTIIYEESRYANYWDVDPSPSGNRTVEFVASKFLSRSDCAATTACFRNFIERVNLTTGERTRLYGEVVPITDRTVRWHDADRIDEDSVVIAGIENDRIFQVNTTSNTTEWSHDLTHHYPRSGGGDFPYDWTHINDVEVTDGGWILFSNRNFDQVAFIAPNGTIRESWSLGADDKHTILYEQHNPDIISPSEGSPSIIVADSENHRVIEYQRSAGEWERTWIFNDSQMAWPRDADRLPNAHTLIVDSNGHRVLEVDESGEIVWSITIDSPYDAERLGTGGGSSGPTASKAALQSHTGDAGEGAESDSVLKATLHGFVKTYLPQGLVNGIKFILPPWMTLIHAAALGVAALSFIGLMIAEIYYHPVQVSIRTPLEVKRE